MQDFVTGIPAGIGHLIKASGNDALRAVSGGNFGNQFMLDDVGKGLVNYYVNESPWGALAQGNLSEAYSRFHANPFDPLFDVATLGYSATGKLAKAGMLGDDAARLAQTPRVLHGTGKSSASLGTYHPNPITAFAQKKLDASREAGRLSGTKLGADAKIAKTLKGTLNRASEAEVAKIANPYMRSMQSARDAAEARIGQQGSKLADYAAYWQGTGMDLDDFLAAQRNLLAGDDTYKHAAGLRRQLQDEAGQLMEAAKQYGDEIPKDLQHRISDVIDREKTLAAWADDPERVAAFQKRLDFYERHADDMLQISELPEMQEAIDAARRLSRATEKEYLDALRVRDLDKFDEAAAMNTIYRNRGSEYRILHGVDAPDEVVARAFYTPHTLEYADDVAPPTSGKVRRVAKKEKDADNLRHNTGMNFLSARSRLDTDSILDTYLTLRETNTRNRLLRGLRDEYQLMTRQQFEEAKRLGADIEDLALDKQNRVRGTLKDRAKNEAVAATLNKLADVEELGRLSDDMQAVAEAHNYRIAAQAMKAGGSKQMDDLVVAVPRRAWEALQDDALLAKDMLEKYDVGTDHWRGIVLSGRAPTWMLNNSVGQAMLASAHHSPLKVFKRLKQIYGSERKRVLEAIDDVAPSIRGSGTSQNFAHASGKVRRAPKGFKDALTMQSRHYGDTKALRVADVVNQWNNKLADAPWRSAAFMEDVAPHLVKYTDEGMDVADALRRLADDNPAALDAAIQKTLSDMVDFRDLSTIERSVMRRIFPFYTWMKGSTKAAGRILRDSPDSAIVGAQLSRAGLAATERERGELPSFLKGSIPVGESSVISTGAMNPFQTPSDIIGGLAQWIPNGKADTYGGESFFAQMNPLPKGVIAAATGTDPFWGSDIKGRPVITALPKGAPFNTADSKGDYFLNQTLNLPQANIFADTMGAFGVGGYEKPRGLYDVQWWQPGLHYLTGVPVKSPKLELAHQRARAERAMEAVSLE